MVAQERHPGAWMARAAPQRRDCGPTAAEPGRLRRRGPPDSLGAASARSHARRALAPGRRLPRSRAAAAAPEPLLQGSLGASSTAVVAEVRAAAATARDHEIVAGLMRIAAVPGDGHTSVYRPRELPLPAARAHAPRRRALRDGGQRHPSPRASGCGWRASAAWGAPELEARAAAYVGHENDAWLRVQVPLLLVIPEMLHVLGATGRPRDGDFSAGGRGRSARLGST